jgi:hypothetical protein
MTQKSTYFDIAQFRKGKMKYLKIETIKKVMELSKIERSVSEPLEENRGTVHISKLPEPPKEFFDLYEFIHSLPNEEIAELVVIMLIGRGDHDIDSYDQKLQEYISDPFHPDYLALKKPLGKYLELGLEKVSK